LLKAARAVWLDDAAIEHRFHHVSTDEIFGSLGAQDAAFVEDDPARPNSPYSASKAASNHLVRAYHQTFNLQATTTNCSNNYGAYQHPEKLIPRFIINALTGRNLPLFGDGQNIRDWLHVEDHCYALEAVLNRGRPGETYNIGGGEELTNAEVAQLLCEAIDAEFRSNQGLAHRFPDAPPSLGNRTDTLLTHVEDRKGHDRRYAINYQKAARELGYTPRQNFAEGIGDTVRWYLSNETWWRDIIK
jgi:dTDP-glucose 4,6-dehydratase